MMKKTGGFTLVELIVVIAILAILAGVTVPAYSGYITKANEGADTQVLGTVNTAIDVATAVNDDVSITATKEGGRVVVSFSGNDASVVAADYQQYMSNNDTTLKYYSSVFYNIATKTVEGEK